MPAYSGMLYTRGKKKLERLDLSNLPVFQTSAMRAVVS